MSTKNGMTLGQFLKNLREEDNLDRKITITKDILVVIAATALGNMLTLRMWDGSLIFLGVVLAIVGLRFSMPAGKGKWWKDFWFLLCIVGSIAAIVGFFWALPSIGEHYRFRH